MDSQAPLRVSRADHVDWHDSADVVVLGFGGAGACAALAAREAGADTIVIDRFEGGGATALSGGVYYGGGTRYQREAGFDDTADDMFRYLKLEVGDVVHERTLRRFCNESAANLDWVAAHGARFEGSVAPDTAPYMAPGYHLYFSGNERVPDYARAARPAPRGHITLGQGGSAGRDLFAALEGATERSGARILRHMPATRLVVDEAGAVIGVELLDLPVAGGVRRRHARAIRLFNKGKGILYGPPARLLSNWLERLERKGTRRLIRATRGVVIATGGFIHNREMVGRHLPHHRTAVPMGSAGCTGAGIEMAEAIGAGTARMDIADTSRTLLVPKTFARGLLVNGRGERFTAEDAYGATIGQEILARQDRKAWLILDSELYRLSWRTIMPWNRMLVRYRLRAFMPLALAWRRARSLAKLAAKCGMDAAMLEATVAAYNSAVAAGLDPLGKLAANMRPVGHGPYYAINCAIDSTGFPPTSFTLGGLVVDEDSGNVVGRSGAAITGLYAAGRAAVGIPSNFYVSGLSIADCVFSGRRAGTAAAEAPVRDGFAEADPRRLHA